MLFGRNNFLSEPRAFVVVAPGDTHTAQ
ncbi:hypothetical protein FMEAI12_7050005 [Parafrankia sp. Ea1.12]|nr:hypothetical protein FMEAI12_7050005 [Parafrankia sp. Ea1.12]